MTIVKTRVLVGMEIHVELATNSKMFTSAPNLAIPAHYEAEPNTLVDPARDGTARLAPSY